MSDTLVTVTLFSPVDGAEDRIGQGEAYEWTAHRGTASDGEAFVTATTIIGGNCGPVTLAGDALHDIQEAFEYENYANAARMISVSAQPFDGSEAA